jgi:hypothetical protein
VYRNTLPIDYQKYTRTRTHLFPAVPAPLAGRRAKLGSVTVCLLVGRRANSEKLDVLRRHQFLKSDFVSALPAPLAGRRSNFGSPTCSCCAGALGGAARYFQKSVFLRAVPAPLSGRRASSSNLTCCQLCQRPWRGGAPGGAASHRLEIGCFAR